ncbi:hypothetical protein, conserved [Eimeria maxima]|uniref:tRNA-uridine aminocarboxypropyltransferase n=1 Tax=Eimeria maxima TaxID=5804 RepID=U6M994_EIMMA|nr:hypothetical protein, conserved [Eimeria maxima]CDJ58250.1 hypothetical protein, conserved [Eimeria maxima]
MDDILQSQEQQQQRQQQQQHEQMQHEPPEQQHNPEQPHHEQNGKRRKEEQQQPQQLQRTTRRRMCSGCDRPCSVCYCSVIQGRELSLSEPEVCSIVNRVLIFMHPLEMKRKNGSVSVLQRLVKGVEIWPHRRPGCCPFAAEQQQKRGSKGEEQEGKAKAVGRLAEGPTHGFPASTAGREVLEKVGMDDWNIEGAVEGSQYHQHHAHQPKQTEPEHKQQHLSTRDGAAACDTSKMLLLFPTESSLALGAGSLPVRLPVTLVAIDGTWKEAKEMFGASPWLQQLPAVHIPIREGVNPPNHASVRPGVGGGTVAAIANADGAASCGSSSSTYRAQALRVSGAYGAIRTPPASVAASGGVCTAEAVALALSVLGHWGRSSSTRLLRVGETTRETLQHLVSLQQRMRHRGNDCKLAA